MSTRALNWVRTVQTGDLGTKAVLRVLADYADSDHSCWPSQELLAFETEQSVRTIRRQIEKLVELGLVAVVEQGWRPGGGRRPNRYVLAVPEDPKSNADNLSPLPGAMRTTTTGNADTDDRQCGQALAGESSKNHQENQPPEAPLENRALGKAARIFGEWLDGLPVRPPRRVLGLLREEVDKLITDDGYPPDVVAEALRQWGERGRAVSFLPTLAYEIARQQQDRPVRGMGWAYNG